MYSETTLPADAEIPLHILPTSFRSRTLSRSLGAQLEQEESAAKLARLVEGLSKLLADEIAQIKSDPSLDIGHFANSKAVYLLELNRMMRLGQGVPLSEQSRELILMLRTRLCENQEALRIHLDAARSVAETIKRAIRDAESDGTYQYGASKRGNHR